MTPKLERDVADVIEIRDPQIDVAQVMDRIRANVKQRRAQGAYRQDLDGIADQVFAEVMAQQQIAPAIPGTGHILPLAELQAQWGIREPQFQSKAPMVGPFIVLTRTAWNWMSTKWYVRIIVQQIQNFHLLVVRAFQDVDVEHRKLHDQVQRLEALVQQQQVELAQLRGELTWRRDVGAQGLAPLPLEGNKSGPGSEA